MRKLLRNIARNNMKLAGIERINNRKDRDGNPIVSKFSKMWRDYVFVNKKYRSIGKVELYLKDIEVL